MQKDRDSSQLEIALVVGARPNFMKAAPLLVELQKERLFSTHLIHTGQHFDPNMSQVFFKQLQLPEPNVFLGIDSESPASFIAKAMIELEKVFEEKTPDLVIVFGDVNSTLAAALVANKMSLPLAHVEAGLRSFDRQMPEEHNRILTDMLSDYLFTPSPDAQKNLSREGVSEDRIYFVGNIMVDTLLRFKGVASEMESCIKYGMKPKEYGLVTLHRPSNVDDIISLESLMSTLIEVSKRLPIVFPIHPRTNQQLSSAGLKDQISANDRISLIPPVSYLEFVSLMIDAKMVLTDSGGIQEETTVLGVPCLTLRDNTERPVTLTLGTNRLVGTSPARILTGVEQIISGHRKDQIQLPELWDGNTANRILQVLARGFIGNT